MKLTYLALAAGMAFSAPAFAAPSSNPSTVPPYGTQIGGAGGEAHITPSNPFSIKTYTLDAGWYTFAIAANAMGAGLGSFGAILTNSSGATVKELSLLTTTANPILFDAINNFHLSSGTYQIALIGSWSSTSGPQPEAAAAIYNGVAPVPGPEAGAGLGALALGGMALYMKRRRREEATAA
jgi:hypothetical protein